MVYGTSGRAVPGYDLRCVTEKGREIGPGEVGELLVRGASAADCYWNKRDKSRATFEGEWTRTGDRCEVTPEGRFVYCGRTDDMFKVSGIWVSRFQVEQALIAHPGVLEAAVVPKCDAEGLEKAWRLVDEVVPNSKFDETVAARAREFAAASRKPDVAEGIKLTQLERSFLADGSVTYSSVEAAANRAARTVTITLTAPDGPGCRTITV